MPFFGYGTTLLAGTLHTVELSILSLLLAGVLGLMGAWGKVSVRAWARVCATLYTTAVRGVPDLVLVLLLFYGLQIWLNGLTDRIGVRSIDLDPFAAGVLTLGIIYGAYFTETFRGAFLAVPRGQKEAAAAFGLTPAQVFRRILFPQMMRYALPGIANNWQVLIKATALISIIGLSDLVRASQDAGKGSQQFFWFTIVAALFYLALTAVSNGVLIWLEARYSAGVRRVES